MKLDVDMVTSFSTTHDARCCALDVSGSFLIPSSSDFTISTCYHFAY